jgi:hypothetical protein
VEKEHKERKKGERERESSRFCSPGHFSSIKETAAAAMLVGKYIVVWFAK